MTQQFEPFQKVLCRQSLDRRWRIDFFAEYNTDSDFPYRCLTSRYRYCISYEGNEHLLATTDSPTPPEPEFKFGDKVEVWNFREKCFKAVYCQKLSGEHTSHHEVLREGARSTDYWKHCRKADW